MKKAAEIVRNNLHQILDSCEQVVKSSIEASRHTAPLLLRDSLPSILKSVADILENTTEGGIPLEKARYKELMQESFDHGRHRAASRDYDAKQIIKEFMMLNRVLTDTLIAENAYTSHVGIIITYTLETAMAYSIDSFDESLQEMREKLVGTLAHDIRNPVSAAYLSVNMMSYDQGEEQFNKLKNISRRSLRRSLSLIEGLLDAITIQAGEGITLSFGKGNIVADIKKEYTEAVDIYSNEITLECAQQEIEGIFDGMAIRRVLENLLTNAAKYGAKGKPITIRIEDHGEEFSMSVHNYGESINKREQEKIFSFMTRRAGDSHRTKSWGIGLSFVKMTAEAHKGRVVIKSDPEHGTSFTVFFNKKAHKEGKVRTKINYKD